MITKYLLKKWTRMLFGRSRLYVNQDQGKFYSRTEIRGYYNDLREKVYKEKCGFGELPVSEITGKTTDFPIQIFQFGLGSYDCYLETNDSRFLESFWKSVDFALEKQGEDGGWVNFATETNPYSSMAQGEGISLLCRAYKMKNDERLLKSIDRAYSFMIKNTSSFDSQGRMYFWEYMTKPLVLNGWMFSLFGLFDYCLLTNCSESIEIMNGSFSLLCDEIDSFDSKRWCYYNNEKMWASKFYMKLHVAQLRTIYELTGIERFSSFANKWERSLKNPFVRFWYFWKKAFQKVFFGKEKT